MGKVTRLDSYVLMCVCVCEDTSITMEFKFMLWFRKKKLKGTRYKQRVKKVSFLGLRVEIVYMSKSR